LYAIAAHYLLLNVEDGWLKTMWRPQGFVIFPGRFSEEKWRNALEAMRALVASLEDGARDVSRERTEGS
jgi:hypothetical protein